MKGLLFHMRGALETEPDSSDSIQFSGKRFSAYCLNEDAYMRREARVLPNNRLLNLLKGITRSSIRQSLLPSGFEEPGSFRHSAVVSS